MRSKVATLLTAAMLAGCGAMATSVAVQVLPDLVASSIGQYNYRGEFADAVPLIKKRDWLGLSTLARQRLEREPDRGEWWQLAGYGHLQAGELVEARDSFARVTRLLPEEVSGWNLYAATLARMGDAAGAAHAVDKALQTDPTSTVSWVLAGDLHAAAGRPKQALQAYDRALEIDKRDIFAWYGVGLLARRSNDRVALQRAVVALKQLYPPFAERLVAPQ